jgi:hypothetical protein
MRFVTPQGHLAFGTGRALVAGVARGPCPASAEHLSTSRRRTRLLAPHRPRGGPSWRGSCGHAERVLCARVGTSGAALIRFLRISARKGAPVRGSAPGPRVAPPPAMRLHVPVLLLGLALGLANGCGSVSSTNDAGGTGGGGTGGVGSVGTDGGGDGSGGNGGSATGSAGRGGRSGGVVGAGGSIGTGGSSGGHGGVGGTGGHAGSSGSAGKSGTGGAAGGSSGTGGLGGEVGTGGKAGTGGVGGGGGSAGTVCGGTIGAQCSASDWCDYGNGGCGTGEQSGVCQARDATGFDCSTPVCGCDGHAYRSACSAHQAGVDTMGTTSCISGNGGAGVPCGSDTDCATGFKCCATGGTLGSPIACRQVSSGGVCPALP